MGRRIEEMLRVRRRARCGRMVCNTDGFARTEGVAEELGVLGGEIEELSRKT